MSLNLRGNGFDAKSCCYLIKNLPCSLIELDISDNEIGDDGVKIICDNVYDRYVEEVEEEEPVINFSEAIEIPKVLDKP